MAWTDFTLSNRTISLWGMHAFWNTSPGSTVPDFLSDTLRASVCDSTYVNNRQNDYTTDVEPNELGYADLQNVQFLEGSDNTFMLVADVPTTNAFTGTFDWVVVSDVTTDQMLVAIKVDPVEVTDKGAKLSDSRTELANGYFLIYMLT